MHCPACGTALEPGAPVCPACGAAVPDLATRPARASRDAAGLMNLARGAKGLALLSLLLPVITVSCGPQKIVSWSGLDLATGRLPPPPPIPGLERSPEMPIDPQPDLFLIAAAALILIGLVATFAVPRRRAAAMAGLAAAASAAALLFYDITIRLPETLYRAMLDGAERQSGQALGADDQSAAEMMRSAISVDPAIGFWLAMAALLATIALCVSVLNRERADAGLPGG